MRLVIEREGGFSIVEDADAITEIDVRSDAVVLTIEVGGDKWTVELPVSSHAEACRVSAAIAMRCGELVEPLSEQSEVDVEAAMGAASAALVRERSRPWKSTSELVLEDLNAVEEWAEVASVLPRSLGEWVAGEPPKGGLWYVVARSGAFGCVAWDGVRFRDWFSETVLMGGEVAHLPTPLPSWR